METRHAISAHLGLVQGVAYKAGSSAVELDVPTDDGHGINLSSEPGQTNWRGEAMTSNSLNALKQGTQVPHMSPDVRHATRSGGC
jgi:hypothetical protein